MKYIRNNDIYENYKTYTPKINEIIGYKQFLQRVKEKNIIKIMEASIFNLIANNFVISSVELIIEKAIDPNQNRFGFRIDQQKDFGKHSTLDSNAVSL